MQVGIYTAAMWLIWLVACILLLASEAHTQAFYGVFLALGALVAAGFDYVGADLWIQGVVFVAVSVGGVLLFRPLLMHWFPKSGHGAQITGVQGWKGQAGISEDEIGDRQHPGHVRLGGERLLAFTNGGPIPAESHVEVQEVLGTTLLVKAKGES